MVCWLYSVFENLIRKGESWHKFLSLFENTYMEVRRNTTDRTFTEGDGLARNRDTDAAAIRPVTNVGDEEGDEDYDDEDDDFDDDDLGDDVEEAAVAADDGAVADLDDADLTADNLDDEDLDLDDDDDEEDDL
jgi:hypothetical protein